MRLNIDQLSSHLQRNELAPIYLLSGDEPLQMLETADMIRSQARRAGAERTVLSVDKGFEWNQIIQESAAMSLFASKRLLDLRMNDQSPGKEGSDVLTAYAENPAPDMTLLVSMEKMDKRSQQSRWFKAIDKAGFILQIWPVELSRLPDWIVQRLRQNGKRIDKAAASLIAQRTEGNLMAAKQELDKLCLLNDQEEITLQQVQDGVTDSTRYGVFMLIEHALLGEGPRIAGMLRGLRQEGIEPIGLFGAIMWELRRLCTISAQISNGASKDAVYTEFKIWNQRQTALNKVLNRFNGRQLDTMLAEAVLVDKSLKGAVKRNPWELIEALLFRLAGINLHSRTNT